MLDCSVQKGTPADAAEIADLVNRAYRGEGEAGWTNEVGLVEGPRTSPPGVLQMMEGGVFLCARDVTTGELVGSVYTEVQDASLYFGMLSVSPVRQNAGLGRLLMEQCELRARELGLASVSLTVLSPRTELQAWYVRRGFVATGETLPFPHGGPWHLVVYRKACEN